MLKDREQVHMMMEMRFDEPHDRFVALGDYDVSTDEKREISNATVTLMRHIPVVKSMVEAARKYPVYVGYSGLDHHADAACYEGNLIMMHDMTEESDMHFAKGFVHELTHLDQDRRGLFYETKTPPPPEKIGSFIMHRLMLEAAAYANEVTALYYLSHYSELRKKVPEVRDYFDEYVAESHDFECMMYIRDCLKRKKIERFEELKPAWRCMFQNFFSPDSPRAKHYIGNACEIYLNTSIDMRAHGIAYDNYTIGGAAQLQRITTLPGWGPMIPDDAMPFMMQHIHGAVFQGAHKDRIFLVQDAARKMVTSIPAPKLTL